MSVMTLSALAAAEWKAVLALETKEEDSILCAGCAYFRRVDFVAKWTTGLKAYLQGRMEETREGDNTERVILYFLLTIVYFPTDSFYKEATPFFKHDEKVGKKVYKT